MKKSIFLFFAAILCSVSAWAANLTAGYYIYFEKPSDWSNVSFLIGHSTYSIGYNMTNIKNTNLYYWKTDEWGGYTEYAFIDATGWGGESGDDKAPSKRKEWAPHKTAAFDTAIKKYHLFTKAGSISSDASDRKKAINRTQTIKVQVKDGENWVDATVVPADLTASTYAMTSSSTDVSAASASLAKESTTVSATVPAAYSATVSLSCTNVLDGYMFEGWYNANGDKITSYTVSDAHTVYARFIQSAEETNEVSVTYMCDATEVSPAIAEIVGVETEKSFTAPTVTGYNFTGWTIGAGITLKAGTASDATITVVTKSASSDYTLVANYEEVMETIYFINTGKWSVVNLHRWNGTATATSWPGEEMNPTGEKIGNYDVYSFTARQGAFANVIFTNKNTGSDQTGDLTWTAGKYYIYNYGGKSGWYTQAEAEELLVVIPDYYITGTIAGGWNGNEVKMTYSGDIWSHTFSASALTIGTEYKLKVTDGTWENHWGTINGTIPGVSNDGDGNVCFKLSTVGDVTVTFDGAKITVSTTGTFHVPVVYDYYIVGDMNSWSTNEDYGLSDENTDGTYERELTWAAGTYHFKINIGNWDKQWGWSNLEGTYKEVQNANDDNKLKVVLTEEKTFTVKFNPTTDKISFDGLSRPTYYLTGNDAVFGYTDGNWTPNTIQMTWDNVNGIYTYTTPTLSANKNYIFRITDGYFGDKKWGYDKLNPAPENVLSFGDDKNICFMLAAEGTITVKFDGEKINLTTTSSFAAPVYTLVGDAAITGCHWDVNSAENQMVQDATDKNKYTLVKTVTAVAGDYDYKAIRNHSYEWEMKGDKLKIEKDGTGTITYTLDIATPKLTAEVSDWVEGSVAQEVTLVGIGEDREFTEAADHLTTSVDVVLEANSVYSFNIVANSVYLKNNGVMWRGNCEGWTFTNEGDKAHIITDLPGTYTFTWTYEGNKLSVKYPDGTNVPVPVFLAGEMNGWDRLATRLIPSADGKTASATITLNRNEKSNFRMVVGTEDWTNPGEMKRNNCTGWTFEKVTASNKDVNASILPDYTDEYTFTWTYAENILSVTYPTEECTDCSGYYLVGEMNGWNQIKDEFMKAEGTAIEVSLELTAGTYEFKIKTGDTWYTNQDADITRTNNTETISNTSGNNAKFTADIDGVYTFTYTTDQKKLTVQYPTPTITLTTGDNSTVIAANIGETVNVKIERSFTANDGYYTLCVPFNMDPSVIGKAYSLGTITEHVAGEGINIELEEETYMLSAGVPYLVLPKANMSELVVENVTIQSVEATGQNITKEELNVQIFFQGYYSASGQTDGSTEYYVGEHGYLYNEVVDIRGLCGLFTITDTETNPINIRARVVTREDETTGFENITNGENTVIKVIENGQLVIIRNGEKFNAQGQKL